MVDQPPGKHFYTVDISEILASEPGPHAPSDVRAAHWEGFAESPEAAKRAGFVSWWEQHGHGRAMLTATVTPKP
jgi:hypothetical protein